MTDDSSRIGIVGAGMAGLACARRLAETGIAATVLDKGRGVGGRLATRRADPGLQFDHGAQFVTARTEAFAGLLADAAAAGNAGTWTTGTRTVNVGVPGMNALAKHLASGLDIRRGCQVTHVRDSGTGWEVQAGTQTFFFDRLIVTVPAPQAAALLGADHPLSRQIAMVRMLPCWTLMAAFGTGSPAPFVAEQDPEAALAWIARDGSKPGRPGADCWVAQASPDWSARHLEEDPADIAPRLLALLCERLDADPAGVVHASAHRWRYAKVARPLGAPFARTPSGTLYLGGDWCLGARVEAAWESGSAIAEDLLERL